MTTKQLAIQLGLVQKRKLKGCISSASKATQEFDYLVVLDFESTCWENGPRMGRQEIIEFPAVLLHVVTGEIVSEFQQYVMPVEQPILSDFCKNLTGITQDQVEAGMPLGACLALFSSWIRKLCDEYQMSFNTTSSGKHVTFATWSDWDLGVCLHYECSRKQLKKPEFFNHWIDVKVTYKDFYRRRPQGLAGALKDLGIAFEGREHSGICDTRNTAVLISRMAKDGCVLKVTKSLSTKFKGNTVKEAAQKVFNQVKSVVLGKRSSEATQDENKQKKLAKIKPLVSAVPFNGNVKQSAQLIKCTDISSGPSILEKRSVDVDSISKRKTNEIGKSKASAVSRDLAPPLRCITNIGKDTHNPVEKSTSPGFLSYIKSDPFKTPVIPSIRSGVKLSLGLSKSSFRTPVSCQSSSSSVSNESMSFHRYKKTPPICGCGRRAKLLLTSKPGPNEGRYFFSCPNGGSAIKKGCKFFKWEDEPYVKAPFINSDLKLARSVPVQRTIKLGSVGNREAFSEPGNKMIRHLGLSKKITYCDSSQHTTPLLKPTTSRQGSDKFSSGPYEVTPYVVKQISKI